MKYVRSCYLPSYRPASSLTQNSTRRLAPRLSPPRSKAATSTFSGLSVSGQLSSMRTARTHSSTLYAGVHASLSRSRQISPLRKAMLACTIGVSKEILGGWRGYEGGIDMSRSQRPSVWGVSVRLEYRRVHGWMDA